MSIIRAANRTRYVVVDQNLVDDMRLSWEAKGLLIYLLGRPPDWCVSATHLVGLGLAGKNKVYRLLAELISAGYCRRIEGRNEKGKVLSYDYIVYETPLSEIREADGNCPVPQNPQAENREAAPVPQNPQAENREVAIINDLAPLPQNRKAAPVPQNPLPENGEAVEPSQNREAANINDLAPVPHFPLPGNPLPENGTLLNTDNTKYKYIYGQPLPQNPEAENREAVPLSENREVDSGEVLGQIPFADRLTPVTTADVISVSERLEVDATAGVMFMIRFFDDDPTYQLSISAAEKIPYLVEHIRLGIHAGKLTVVDGKIQLTENRSCA